MKKPTWNELNLKRHHRKRITKDAGCFERLLGITGRAMTMFQYEERSEAAYQNAWAEFQGEGRNRRASEHYPLSTYFVDDELIVAVTDLARQEFHTCFHEHFDRACGVDPGPGVSVGQRRLRYIDGLNNEERGGMTKNLKRIRGV